MKIWILRPVKDFQSGDNPWEPWYDKAFGFVVRAETEDQARAFAQERAGDEGWGPWIYADYSTCEELSGNGYEGVLMTDFRAA